MTTTTTATETAFDRAVRLARIVASARDERAFAIADRYDRRLVVLSIEGSGDQHTSGWRAAAFDVAAGDLAALGRDSAARIATAGARIIRTRAGLPA